MWQCWLIPFALIATTLLWSEAAEINNHMIIRSKRFSSPSFPSTPGSVVEKFYYNIDFPKGHIAMKSFDVEVVDETGNQVPLLETYLHHWALVRYYQHKNAPNPSTIISHSLIFRNQTTSLRATMESARSTLSPNTMVKGLIKSKH